MRCSNRRLKNNGFTLIELMVVVSILGILVAIAIPNYHHYVAKSHQIEAKVQLAAAFTAEKSFVIENGSFTGCLAQTGYAPDGTSLTRYYTIGMVDQTGTNCGPSGNVPCNYYQFETGYQASCTTGSGVFLAGVYANPAGVVATAANLPGAAASASGVSETTFTLGAAGEVSNSTTNYDLWIIDQEKVLTNVTATL